MIVLTVDQRRSRTQHDAVPTLLAELNEQHFPLALAFERTVGDEIQGVLPNPTNLLEILELIQRNGSWSVGIGVGTVEEPLARTARASRGPAFLAAREAIESAKSIHPSLDLVANWEHLDTEDRNYPIPTAALATDAASLLRLILAIWTRRSQAGWQAIDAIRTGGIPVSQRRAASDLNITPAALHDRLRAAMWEVEVNVHPLAQRLLADLHPLADSHSHEI